MKATLLRRLAGVFVVLALTCVLSVKLPAQVFAQDATPTDPCLNASPDNEDCNKNVGGTSIKPKDIKAAINSPTPNLANTTAYVFYTLSVLMTNTFDPGYNGPTKKMNDDGSAAPSDRFYAEYPTSTGEALQREGFMGALVYLTAEMVKNPPASSQVYFADLIQNSRFGGSPAYAQGIGFGALTPILGTWKAFRDVAYYLLTIMFLVTGFLILIRHKISGNMAVTVQNALPRLVLTLILITFSYAIAGLVVDIMFLSLYFITGIFTQYIFIDGANFGLGLAVKDRSLTQIVFDTHIFTFTLGYIFSTGKGSAWGAASALGDMVWGMLDDVAGPGGAILDVANALTLGQLDNIMGVIFTLIFGIALLIAMFRTFFALVMSYAGFVINVVMSPLILITGAIPGKNPFPGWLKNLIGGMAPFVVAVFMILMSLALTGSETRAGVGYGRTDPGTNGLRLPLILSDDIPADSFIGILAMGFMLLLPEAVKMSKKMVGATGGIFDEYRDAALNNFKQGWSGNKYIPGAKSIVSKAGAGAALGTLGAVSGYREARRDNKPVGESLRRGVRYGAGGLAAPVILPPVMKIKNKAQELWKNYGQPVDKWSAVRRAIDREKVARDAQTEKAQAGTPPGGDYSGGSV